MAIKLVRLEANVQPHVLYTDAYNMFSEDWVRPLSEWTEDRYRFQEEMPAEILQMFNIIRKFASLTRTEAYCMDMHYGGPGD
jgi:hypothetical protein